MLLARQITAPLNCGLAKLTFGAPTAFRQTGAHPSPAFAGVWQIPIPQPAPQVFPTRRSNFPATKLSPRLSVKLRPSIPLAPVPHLLPQQQLSVYACLLTATHSPDETPATRPLLITFGSEKGAYYTIPCYSLLARGLCSAFIHLLTPIPSRADPAKPTLMPE